MKREVSFCSDHLSNLIFSKRLVRNQITYGFHTVPHRNVFTIPLKISTQIEISWLNKGHNNSSNLAMKIFNNHGRKNLPRQINHRKSPVIIRSFDHSKNERKKVDVNEITKHGVPLLFRTPEALKSLNNKTFTRKIEQNHLHLLVPRVPSLRFLAGQYL